jgi:hypothetical protein
MPYLNRSYLFVITHKKDSHTWQTILACQSKKCVPVCVYEKNIKYLKVETVAAHIVHHHTPQWTMINPQIGLPM